MQHPSFTNGCIINVPLHEDLSETCVRFWLYATKITRLLWRWQWSTLINHLYMLQVITLFICSIRPKPFRINYFVENNIIVKNHFTFITLRL